MLAQRKATAHRFRTVVLSVSIAEDEDMNVAVRYAIVDFPKSVHSESASAIIGLHHCRHFDSNSNLNILSFVGRCPHC